MPKKMPRRLVALSASAVATIYFAGLLSTRANTNDTSASTDGDTPTVPVAAAGVSKEAAPPTTTPTVVVGATAALAATSTPSPVIAKTGYADGTYSGTGSGRFGSVSVSVTTASGKITNVQITRATTTFPVSRIASLPARVVQTQGASVNAVSGATASSQAFKQAIQQALGQALAANSTATASA